MKITSNPLNALILSLSIILTGCSDKQTGVCPEINVTMKVNGELQSFEVLGYGIDLTPNGHMLHLNLHRGSQDPFREQGIAIFLPYKKTGTNVIEQFIYHQYIDDMAFDGDFTDGEFESRVITNTNTCFYATFSGKLHDGTRQVVITEGTLSYTYVNPFEL